MTQPAPYSQFQVADVVLPLSTNSENSLLQDCDAPVFFAIDYFTFLINQYVGARMQQEAAGANIQVIPQAIAQTYSWPPDLEFTSNQFRFPLLAMYRKTSTFTRKAASWEHDRCTFDLLYVLPPLTGGQLQTIVPILRPIAMTIRKKTTQSFDPAYTPPGGTLGQTPWGLKFAGVEEIGFDRDEYITFQNTGNLKFPMLAMSGYFVERDMYIPGPKFAGGDVSASLVSNDQTVVPNLAQDGSQQAPTITSINPSSGPMAGGTTVNISGSLFLAGPPAVFVGVHRAWNITYNGPTSVTIVTPANDNQGSVSIVLTNRDGQSAISPQRFTYT